MKKISNKFRIGSIEEKLEIINKELKKRKECYNLSSDDIKLINWDHNNLVNLTAFVNQLTLLKKENRIDSRRWYILHEDIYEYIDPETGDGYYVGIWHDIGIWHIGEYKSKAQDREDIIYLPQFKLMKRVKSYEYHDIVKE